MRRAILSLTLLVLLVAGASRATAGGLDLRIGGYFPRGNETLFLDVRSLYFVEKSDFYGLYGGIEYNQVLDEQRRAGRHFDGYSQTVDTSYRDYERPGGGEIFQSLKLRHAPARASRCGSCRRARRPRSSRTWAAACDAIFYQYEEYGDFIDFGDPELPIYADAFVADGTAFGVHVLGGLRVLPQPRHRDRGRGPLPVGDGRDGRRLRSQRARARQHDRPLGMDGHDRRAHTVLTHAPQLRDADPAGHEARGAAVSRPGGPSDSVVARLSR